MSRNYVDNAMNRKLGRVGMPLGSAVHSGGSSFSGSSFSSGSSSSNFNTYVDNSMNRGLGRVGMEYGTAVHSRSSPSSSSSSSKTYVDNSMNRGLGRVGMEYGTAVHSSGSSSSCSSKTYVDNSMNRGLGRVGMEYGTAVHSRPSSSSSSSSSKTYVDSSLNRALGRVGLEHGTAVHSRSDSLNDKMQQLTTSSQSMKVYKDNPLNQKLGRAGQPFGSMPQSSQSASAATPKKSDSSHAYRNQPSASTDRSMKVYKDNKLNRKLGRAGQPFGSMPQSSQSARAATPKQSSSASYSGKVYVDNDYNRKHNRVGKPLGSVPIPANTQVYKDTPLSRYLGRVGKPWGTCPNKSLPYEHLMQMLMQLRDDEEVPDDIAEVYERDEVAEDFIDHFMDLRNRERTVREQLEEKGTNWKAPTHKSSHTFEKYKGAIIRFEELEFMNKIGHGGFGDVYMAKLIDGQVVAVKKLRVERVSQRRRQQFEDEIKLFCTLQHPNIVGFLGACVVSPNLAIVMEYMDLSLHEALHNKQVDFLDQDKLNIMRDVSQGLDYLHGRKIAHCDLKTQNVLLNNVPGQETTNSQGQLIAKITDFGLSMMKNEVETGTSSKQAVSNIGTPRYSAPEVLRGELLNVEQLMKADVYSEGLLILELVVEEIAFEDLTIQQLRVQVGEKNLKPDIRRGLTLDKQLKEMLEKCWSSKPDDRPSSHSVCLMVDNIQHLLKENRDNSSTSSSKLLNSSFNLHSLNFD
ncbi:uncharacterized protein LOC131934613 [Physella acuta]|uniref:uncharacterized protein LOC131934613 n=1 Tax=Physella acuta TaxID=109671 RepID=UPI0027DD75B8|nr:uncharacterized protein LOC131934613 [Physella acuta]